MSFKAVMVLAILLSLGSVADAAEIRVLSGGGLRSVLQELFSQFERASGHTVINKFGISAQLGKAITEGEQCDVAILNNPLPEQLAKQGQLARETLVEIARVGVGVAIRSGAAKTDISTVDAFKRALLAAKSLSYAEQSQSGVYFAKLIERLGIADAISSKAKLMAGGAVAVVGPVARGEVEIAVSAISDILATEGVDLLGPFPPELQTYVMFTAGVRTSAKQPDAARILIDFLSSPEAESVIKAQGMETR